MTNTIARERTSLKVKKSVEVLNKTYKAITIIFWQKNLIVSRDPVPTKILKHGNCFARGRVQRNH
jgi:hypothetical protein